MFQLFSVLNLKIFLEQKLKKKEGINMYIKLFSENNHL